MPAEILGALGPAASILGVWLFVSLGLGIGMLVWYLWAMARLFSRIGMNSADGWIPVVNQWKLLDRAGLPGWVVLLNFVGLGIVPAVMLIVAMHRIGSEYRAGAGYTVLGVFFPPLWATLLANFVSASGLPPAASRYTNYTGGNAASGGYRPGPQPGFAPPAPPALPAPPAALASPAPPAAFAPPAPPAPPAALAPPAPPAQQQPWAAGASGGSGVAAARYQPPLGRETEAEYDRLASEGFQAPPATPLGQNQAPSPFSWTAARAAQQQEQASEPVAPAPVIPPVHPLAASQQPPAPPVPQAPAPAAPAAPPAPPAPEPPAALAPPSLPASTAAPAPPAAPESPAPPAAPESPAPPAAPESPEAPAPPDEPMDLDHTVVAPRRSDPAWLLELPDGTQLPLEADVVVGRKPKPIDGSAALEVPDRTRTLSKSHARLTREGDSWLVEDLGSTNGLVLMNDDGTESELSPGVRVEATERMLFGTLEVRLLPGGDAA